MKLPYNARTYIMRASYEIINTKMCGKVNKDTGVAKVSAARGGP